MSYSRDEIKLVQQKVTAAVNAALVGTGFAIEANKGTYGDTMSIRLGFKRTGQDGERLEWNANCASYGLTPEHFGATFSNNGVFYQAIGFCRGRTKFVLRGRAVNGGKELLFSSKSIERLRSGVAAPVKVQS